MKPHTVTIPVTDSTGRKRFPRVGAMFGNRNRETGEVFYTIRLDYPVAVTDLLVFPPRPAAAAASVVEDPAAETDPAEAVTPAQAAGGQR